jgi:class 3 adenylate cyclase/tetratricopeptide (TPR) repeat protein
VTHPARLVTKDELLEAVWPDTAVTDAVVRVAIGAVRKALGEIAQTPRYIATVPRRGYRFLAAVTLGELSAPPTPEASLQSAVPAPHPQEVGPLLPDGSPGPIEVFHVEYPTSLGTQGPPSPATLGGERKQVTVLVGAIPETLALLRDRDAEVVQQLVEPALQAMMEAVHRYGGMVHQVREAGLLALFGAPLAHEDHALRACYAALAMQTVLRGYADNVQRTHGWILQSCIGLHAGEVVIRARRHDGLRESSLLGPTTALAERLQQWAPPGTIVLSATTARLVAGATRVTAVGHVTLAGLAEPVEVYELHEASGRPGRLHTARARGLTPLVGRQEELAALHRVLPQVAAGHGQLVAVVGEAGVGKSRLVDELLQVASTQGWRVLDSAAASYGQAIPYFPVLTLLRRYWHLEEGEAPASIAAQVTAQVVKLEAALQDAIPALLAVLDALPADSPFLSLDPPQRRQHTFTALKRLLVRESQVQPLLLVVEDLHWLDTETQALLESLSASLPTARLLLLVNYRPEYQHGWGSKTYYTQLRLDPLPPTSADAFLRALLGDKPNLEPLKHLLIARTEGNPFFLEESVRTLVEAGALVGALNSYQLARDLPSIQVPATVQAVLAARLDRLPPETKHLIQTAAVIGHEVPLALLQVIADLTEESLHRHLAQLQEAEFLYETHLLPERGYTFKHALTHEVAYSTLLQERRRALHARIVEAVEALAREQVTEQVERLAYHALRGAVWNKALVYCRQAGEKALARSAYREAVGYFEQALSALPHLQETRSSREQAIDLRLALRSALEPSGDLGRILAALREAESLAATLDDPRRMAQISLFLSVDFAQRGAYDQAIAAAQHTLALTTTNGEVVLHALANYRLGRAYQAKGDYRRAIDCLGQTVASLKGAQRHERVGQVIPPTVLSRAYLATCHAELGTFAEGITLGDEGLQIAEAVAHPASLMIASWGGGLLALHQGNLHRALPLLERAMGICQDADLPAWFPSVAVALGAAYTLGGCVADGVALLTRAIEQTTVMERVGVQTLCSLALGEAHMLAGHTEEAHALTERTLALARNHQERGHEAYALRLIGDIAARREPPESASAKTHYRQALALAEELGMRPLQAHCHLGLGTLYVQTGRPEPARTELTTAIALYRAMDMTFWLPQAEAALAQAER